MQLETESSSDKTLYPGYLTSRVEMAIKVGVRDLVAAYIKDKPSENLVIAGHGFGGEVFLSKTIKVLVNTSAKLVG